MATPAVEQAGTKPWYLRWWSWLIAIVALLVLIGSLNDPKPDDEAGSAAATSVSSAPVSPSTGSLSSAPPSSSPAPSSSAVAADSSAAQPADAQITALLATLPVKGRAPKTGYDRALFGTAWTDDVSVDDGHNGCDTRNDVLRRDLVAITLKPGSYGCTVLSGTLNDPYTGKTIPFVRGQGTSSAVQIDHLVALADAWQKGAQQLSPSDRVNFANDPLNLQAVDGPTNAAKGAGDAATWLPPNKMYRCTYVSRQVQVKAKYGLWVTAAERDAIVTVLGSCGAPTTATTQPTPPPAATAPTPPPAPAPQVTTAPAPAPPAQTGVYYQNCSAAKAAGAAPLYAGQPGYRGALDRDNDGVACE